MDRFGRGQRATVDEAASFGNEALKIGAKIGSDAIEQVATQAKKRPLITLAVAIGVGILIGLATRRNRTRSANSFSRPRTFDILLELTNVFSQQAYFESYLL